MKENYMNETRKQQRSLKEKIGTERKNTYTQNHQKTSKISLPKKG